MAKLKLCLLPNKYVYYLETFSNYLMLFEMKI